MQGADGHTTDKQIDKNTSVDKRQPNNGQIDEQTNFQTYKQMQTQIHNQTYIDKYMYRQTNLLNIQDQIRKTNQYILHTIEHRLTDAQTDKHTIKLAFVQPS